MKQFRKKLMNRIKNSKGMSLGEVLFAILIMLLSTGVLVSVVSLGVSHYVETLSRSEANVLSSTLQSVMTSELAYTQCIQEDSDPDITYFQSQNYTIDKDGLGDTKMYKFFIGSPDSDGYGKVLIGSDTDNLKLISDKSYPNDLGVKDIKVSYNEDDHIFTVSFTIGRKGEEIMTQEFQVINVNNTEPTTGT